MDLQHPSLLQNRPLFQAICPGSLWARDNRWLLSRVQRLAGPGGDRGLLSRLEAPTETKGPHSLLSQLEPPTGNKRPPFCPGWSHQPGQKAPLLSRLVSPTGTKGLGPFIPFPLPPLEPFSSLVLAVLGSGEGSSCSFLHHICEDL